MGTDYQVEISTHPLTSDYRPGDISKVVIRGLRSEWDEGDVELLDLRSLKTNLDLDSYPTVELPAPVTHYYAGMGEGQRFKTLREALHCSLYDHYQCNDNLKEGDILTCTFQDQTLRFLCAGVHVIPVEMLLLNGREDEV